MNAELIQLSRKAAREFAGTDGYSQAGQLINMLCDELEAAAQAETLPSKEKAYRDIAKHVFRAHPKYEGNRKALVLLADDIHEAEKLAMSALGTSSVFVARVTPTADPRVYEV